MSGHTPWLFDNVDTAIFMKNNEDQFSLARTRAEFDSDIKTFSG